MGFFQGLLALFSGFFKSIPIFDKWFSKSTTEKVEKRQDKTDGEVDEAKKTGRPKWGK